ncbi:MAG: alpha/beta hydrolase [SAR202 cluster bacterium]|nr:alpha/beta hydrolase [SAR202 cluster bacterium]
MRKLLRDVDLAFEESSAPEPIGALVLVHGWACDHTYMAPLFRHFAARYRVVSVDLRGHGESDCPAQDYTIDGFADDVAWLCDRLGIRSPVIIGHSMGGVVAYEAAARHPGLARAIVALDSPLAMDDLRVRAMRPLRRRFHAPEYRELVKDHVRGMFLPTDDADMQARIVEGMSSRPQHVIASAMEHMLLSRSASAATTPPVSVPVLAVASAGGHMTDLDRLSRLCPGLVTGQTLDSGHFLQLQVPARVVSMIERFLENDVLQESGPNA